MSLDLIRALCFLSQATVLPFFFRASIFQNAGMRSSSFSEPSALNSLSFVSTMISSSCSHHLSWLSSSPLWKTIKSGSIVPHFYFPWFMLLKNFFFASISVQSQIVFGSTKTALFLCLHVQALSPLIVQIPRAIAEGVSPHGDAATLPGAYAPSQPALCLEMKAEAMEKHFLSRLCSVFGCERSGQSTRGSPGCGVGVRH